MCGRLQNPAVHYVGGTHAMETEGREKFLHRISR